MLGREFESEFCKILKGLGYWALRIPRNYRGAQPFDVLAIKGKEVLAIDCKVSSGNLFQMSRIEANQWSAFGSITTASQGSVKVGVAILYDGNIYWVSYNDLFAKLFDGMSLKISAKYLWIEAKEIEKILGKGLT